MKLLIAILLILLFSRFVMADYYTYRHNPYTGRRDMVTIIAPNITPSGTYTGFTFDGTNWCLWVLGVSMECWLVEGEYLLLEDGTYLLLEDGIAYLMLEEYTAPSSAAVNYAKLEGTGSNSFLLEDGSSKLLLEK